MGANVAGTAIGALHGGATSSLDQGISAGRAVRDGMVEQLDVELSSFAQARFNEGVVGEAGQWVAEKGEQAYDVIEENFGTTAAELAKGAAEAGLDIAGLYGARISARGVQNSIQNIKTARHVEGLLEQTTASADDLKRYLQSTDHYLNSKGIESNLAKDYLETSKWPKEMQIPRDPNFLKENGSIDWNKHAPNNGYALDESGKAIKETFTPQVGEVIDRYGPPDGRYTSPVIDDVPYNYEKRSLPYVEDQNMYHQYEITGDFSNIKEYFNNSTNMKLKTQIIDNMERYDLNFNDFKTHRGIASEAFGKGNGGATQYELPLSVDQLEDLGLIKKIK